MGEETKEVYHILVGENYRVRSQLPRGLRHRSPTAGLLRLWVRIPPGHGCLCVMTVVCQVSSLRRADHSSRGVLPTVVRRYV